MADTTLCIKDYCAHAYTTTVHYTVHCMLLGELCGSVFCSVDSFIRKHDGAVYFRPFLCKYETHMLIFIFAFLCVWGAASAPSEAAHPLCPNSCSGHGICQMSSATISCSCFPSYHGGDCSYRICPSGVAWVDYPSADNVAHSEFTECSNMVIL